MIRFSGFPKADMTIEEKNEYVEKIKTEMGFDITVEEICSNPVKKQLFKLMLNVRKLQNPQDLSRFSSFQGLWGKLAQQNNQFTNTEYLTSIKELFDITTDPTKEIVEVELINESYMMCCWKHCNREITSKTSCLAVACLVTSLAR